MRWAVVVLTLGACGRVGFDPLADAFVQDAYDQCVAGDNVCPVACVATDPDCQTVCGDGTCVGNAGELCGNCPADCATTQVVCGNARCETGENPDCYADCGPNPWLWDTQEGNLLTQVNAARKNGVTCPGDTTKSTAPALALATSSVTKNAAREWAWEIAHHGYVAPNGSDGETCNGLTFQQRSNQGMFVSGVISYSATSAADAVSRWKGIANTCHVMMSKNVTKGLTGVAFDGTQHGWVLLMK